MVTMCFKVNIFIYEKIVGKLKPWVGLGKNSNHALSTVLSEEELYMCHELWYFYFPVFIVTELFMNLDQV